MHEWLEKRGMGCSAVMFALPSAEDSHAEAIPGESAGELAVDGEERGEHSWSAALARS